MSNANGRFSDNDFTLNTNFNRPVIVTRRMVDECNRPTREFFFGYTTPGASIRDESIKLGRAFRWASGTYDDGNTRDEYNACALYSLRGPDDVPYTEARTSRADMELRGVDTLFECTGHAAKRWDEFHEQYESWIDSIMPYSD